MSDDWFDLELLGFGVDLAAANLLDLRFAGHLILHMVSEPYQ